MCGSRPSSTRRASPARSSRAPLRPHEASARAGHGGRTPGRRVRRWRRNPAIRGLRGGRELVPHALIVHAGPVALTMLAERRTAIETAPGSSRKLLERWVQRHATVVHGRGWTIDLPPPAQASRRCSGPCARRLGRCGPRGRYGRRDSPSPRCTRSIATGCEAAALSMMLRVRVGQRRLQAMLPIASAGATGGRKRRCHMGRSRARVRRQRGRRRLRAVRPAAARVGPAVRLRDDEPHRRPARAHPRTRCGTAWPIVA